MSDIFSPEALAKSVHATLDDAFQAIPDGKRAALLMTADTHSASALVAARINDHWQLAAGGTWEKDAKPIGKVALVGYW